MRKKIGLLSLLFLLFGFLTGMAQADTAKLQLKAAPLSPAFLEYQESLKQKAVTQADALPSRKAAPRGYIPSPVDLSHLKNADYSAYFAGRAQGEPFPVSYDLRAHDAVTQVENQSPHGTCWAFAAIGSLESVYLKRTGTELNLSELHLAHYAYMDPVGFTRDESEHVLDNGGYNTIAVAALARWTGAVLEEKLPYDYETPAGPSTNYPNRLHLQDAFFLALPPVQNVPATDPGGDINDIRKELIMSYGGVSVGMGAEKLGDALDLPGYNDIDSWCNLANTQTDHAVLIVGWDDGYSRENFEAIEGPEGLLSRQPSRDGAWLIKNSWGADHFDGGYFWLSYEDDSLVEATVLIPEEAANYDNIYDYDELGWCASLGAGDNATTGWMANVFTARGSEELEAVSFYTTGANATYEISVYTGLSDASVPTSGTRVAFQTGLQSLAGYHTEELNMPVPLAQGITFAVVIKMTTPSFASPLAVEFGIVDYSENAEFEPGVSFTSVDGTDWEDLYEVPATACIKAFTVNSDTPAPEPNPSSGSGGGCSAAAGAAIGMLPLVLWAFKRTTFRRAERS